MFQIPKKCKNCGQTFLNPKEDDRGWYCPICGEYNVKDKNEKNKTVRT